MSLDSQSVFGQLMVESGRMKFGRACVRSIALSYNFKVWGSTPWILERRDGVTRGIFYRLVADDRFSGQQILSEVQWCLITLISAVGFSVHRMVFGSEPADLFGWDGREEDLLLTQATSLSGQFAQQWKLRMRARKLQTLLSRRRLTASCVVSWLHGYCDRERSTFL